MLDDDTMEKMMEGRREERGGEGRRGENGKDVDFKLLLWSTPSILWYTHCVQYTRWQHLSPCCLHLVNILIKGTSLWCSYHYAVNRNTVYCIVALTTWKFKYQTIGELKPQWNCKILIWRVDTFIMKPILGDCVPRSPSLFGSFWKETWQWPLSVVIKETLCVSFKLSWVA